MSCAVFDCNSQPTTTVADYEITNLPPLDSNAVLNIPVCDFHAQAIRAREPAEIGDDGRIRLGASNLAPMIVGFALADSGGTKRRMHLTLGHDGIEEQRIEIRISDELFNHLYMNPDAELAKEAARNQTP